MGPDSAAGLAPGFGPWVRTLQQAWPMGPDPAAGLAPGFGPWVRTLPRAWPVGWVGLVCGEVRRDVKELAFLLISRDWDTTENRERKERANNNNSSSS
ncbi:unnamed protein product [Merluccius merluccius]